MAENFILFIFLILPPILFVSTRLYIQRVKDEGRLKKVRPLLIGNALVFSFLLSIGVLAGEIHFRFFFDGTDSFALCKTTKRWFERHFKSNKTGFRDSVNYLPMVETGKRRITFVGDSFTAGHGIPDVEDRFANRVRALRPEHEVHVLAMCGWDTGKEIELIEFIPTSGYEEDIVVLAYCLNDISDITPEWSKILKRIYDEPKPGFFVKNSFFLNTMNARLQMAREPEIVNYYSFIQKAYSGSIWEKQQTRLKEFQDAVTSAGGTLIVVTFPFLHDLGDDYKYGKVHKQLDIFWATQNVPHLDLLEVFADETPSQVILSPRDVHPNVRAHAIAAEAIAKFVDDQIAP